jgi:hypothetical protein
MEDSRSPKGIDARTWVAPVLEHLREGGEVGWVFLYEEDPADHARVSYRRRGHGGADSQGGVLHLSFRTGSKGSVLHLSITSHDSHVTRTHLALLLATVESVQRYPGQARAVHMVYI